MTLRKTGSFLSTAGYSVKANQSMCNNTMTEQTFKDSYIPKGSFLPSILCVGLGFFDCTQSAFAIGLMTIAVSCIGFHYGAGVMVNHADVAPKYASLLFGISNTFATLPGFLAPYAIGQMTTNVSI